VVLDAQQHAPVERARQAPDVDGVHDVPEVQVPCRGRSEAGEGMTRQASRQRSEVRTHDRRC
jgi:hypothetical protein